MTVTAGPEPDGVAWLILTSACTGPTELEPPPVQNK
jgi:hypothetical protein